MRWRNKKFVFGNDLALLKTPHEFFHVSGVEKVRDDFDSATMRATAERMAEAKRLTNYLWQRDYDAMSYLVDEEPDGWTAKRLYVEDGHIKYEEVARADSETEGRKMAWVLEEDELIGKGYSGAAVEALLAVTLVAI